MPANDAQVNAQFESIMLGLQQKYKDARTQFAPPPGDYDCEIIGLRKGVSQDKDTKANVAWFKFSLRILDGDLENKEFSSDIFSTRDEMSLARIKSLTRVLTGREIDDTVEMLQSLDESLGKLVRVSVTETTSRKNGQTYTNVRIRDLIDTAGPSA